MSSILIACDGSSRRNAEGNVGGPIAWAWAREDDHWYANGDISGTNQKAELLALMTVLLMHPNENLHIQSDSRYALNTTEKWMWGWAKKGWRKGDGEEIVNKEVVQQIHALMLARTKKVEFQWVKGHDKTMANPLNHKADELATTVSDKIRTAVLNNETISSFYTDSKGREFNEFENNIVEPLLFNNLTQPELE